MELQFHGANCLSVKTKQGRFVIDDTLAAQGLKAISNKDDIALFTEGKIAKTATDFVINSPGEYEVRGVSVMGVRARGHMDEEGKATATIYKIITDEHTVVVLGHVYPSLDDDQLEALGRVDVLVVPVGNSGFTLDSTGALKLIRKIEPRIAIPVHYEDSAVKYEVPQQPLEVFTKEIGIEPEKLAVFKSKDIELGSENLRVIVLERQ